MENYEERRIREAMIPKGEHRGGTRKIGDVKGYGCNSPEHNPPMHAVFEPGIYEHICPQCGHRSVFTVNPPTF